MNLQWPSANDKTCSVNKKQQYVACPWMPDERDNVGNQVKNKLHHQLHTTIQNEVLITAPKLGPLSTHSSARTPKQGASGALAGQCSRTYNQSPYSVVPVMKVDAQPYSDEQNCQDSWSLQCVAKRNESTLLKSRQRLAWVSINTRAVGRV